MAPKSTKGMGVAKDAGATEPLESALAAQRMQLAYFPLTVNVFELWEAFKPLRGVKKEGEKSGHPDTHIIPAPFAKPGPDKYPFSSITSLAGSAPLSLISSMTSCIPTDFTF